LRFLLVFRDLVTSLSLMPRGVIVLNPGLTVRATRYADPFRDCIRIEACRSLVLIPELSSRATSEYQ